MERRESISVQLSSACFPSLGAIFDLSFRDMGGGRVADMK